MSLRSRIANQIGTRVIPYGNSRVMCPPGAISPNGNRNILVMSPMRSGTHLMIDYILNNFPAYRRRPLFVDLDDLFRRGRHPSRYGGIGDFQGYVFKGHFPVYEGQPEDKSEFVERLDREAFSIVLRRNLTDIEKSIQRFQPESFVLKNLEANYERFHEYWRNRADITVCYDDLTNPARIEGMLRQIAEATGQVLSSKIRHCRGPDEIGRIYIDKALTRLLGWRAPVINTTIHTLK